MLNSKPKERKCKQILQDIVINKTSNNSGGNSVEGVVEICSDTAIQIHGILVTVHGDIWTSISSYSNYQHKYSSNIFVQSLYIYGKETGTVVLSQGPHNLPFTLSLPPHLPSSFDGTYGAISFMISAEVHSQGDLKGNSKFHKISQSLPVSRFLDLSLGTAYKNIISFPSSIHRPLKTFKAALNVNHRLKFVFKIQKTGYATGETIPFVMDLYNPDKRNLSTVSVVLTKKTVYGDLKYNIDEFDELADVSATVDSNKQTLTWIGSLYVPQFAIPTHSIVASVPRKKSIFAHRYLLRVKLVPTSGACVVGDMPIVIGTTKYECRSRRPSNHCSRSTLRINMEDSIRGETEPNRFFRRQSSLPPSYSQYLHSSERRPSLETLPPPYEEAVAMASKVIAKQTRHLIG